MGSNPFLGRNITVVGDLSLDEMSYILKQARELKQIILRRDWKAAESFRIQDKWLGLYEVFFEDSTRTEESFKNAAGFHGIKHNQLNVQGSSVNKHESLADTFNTLIGFDNHIFAVRSKLEGACRWLAKVCNVYATRNGIIPLPVFLNAGDGQHEHPTQEFLDEFTFLESDNWNNSHIHIAMIGDLLHGRTVHSKVNGLKLYGEVKADLIAPEEIQMPQTYIEKMKANRFEVRIFQSIEEYLSQNSIASKWYFTRPQLERMGEAILRRQNELRAAITFEERFLERIPESTIFYHPLPRHREHPVIPTWLDNTPFNGWDRQSRNGYFTRIILLAVVTGQIGNDFKGEVYQEPVYKENFITQAPILPDGDKDKEINEGMNPLKQGVVIDHICKGDKREVLWPYVEKIRRVIGFYSPGYIGVGTSRKDGRDKGLIFLPKYEMSDSEIKMLAAVAPGCTVNLISNSEISQKLRLDMPPRIYGLPEIACTNPDCIAHPSHFEGVNQEFIRQDNESDLLTCFFCGRFHSFKDIWK